MQFSKIRSLALAGASAAALVAFAAGSAQAEEAAATGPAITWNFSAATDYIFRGISQTDEKAAASGGVDVTFGQAYVGAWASNVDFSPADTHTSTEIDVYGGWRPAIKAFNLDLGVIYYGYANAPKNPAPRNAYWEGAAKASKTFEKVTLGASVFYSPNFFAETGDAWYYEGNAALAASDKVSFSGAIGHQDIQKAIGYTTWNLGATYTFKPGITFDVRYYDTNKSKLLGEIAGSRVVAAAKVSF